MKIYETLDDNTVLIDGIKYQKVKQEPKSLYDMLEQPYCVINAVSYNYNEKQKEHFCKIVNDWLKDNRWNSEGEYSSGWNDCLEDLQLKENHE